MADVCCGVVSESETRSTSIEPSSRAARRRRMEIRRFKFVTGAGSPPEEENEKQKRQKLDVSGTSSSSSTSSSSLTGEWDNAVENGACSAEEKGEEKKQMEVENGRSQPCHKCLSPPSPSLNPKTLPKYGVTSVCGNRRDMEDAVAVHPSFYHKNYEKATDLHYFGVYDAMAALMCLEKPKLSVEEREYLRFAYVKRKKDFSWSEKIKEKDLNILEGLSSIKVYLVLLSKRRSLTMFIPFKRRAKWEN